MTYLKPVHPVIHPKFCVNGRSTRGRCRVCRDSCPVDGALGDGNLPFPSVRCLGCGGCVRACPSGALTLDSNWVELILKHKSGRCTIACEWSIGTERADLTLPCLAQVDEVALTALADLPSEIVFISATCESCPLGVAMKGFEVMSAAVLTWLNDRRLSTDIPPVFYLRRITYFTVNPSEIHRHLSRRTLFGLLKRPLTKSPTDQDKLKNEKTLSLRRRLALLTGEKNDFPATARFKVWRVEVDESCFGCKVCSELCPTEALRCSIVDGIFHLYAYDTDCTGCGLCTDVCLERAVKPIAADINKIEVRCLVEKPLKRCLHCDRETTEGSLCRYCQNTRNHRR